jgi:hypothetical protein
VSLKAQLCSFQQAPPPSNSTMSFFGSPGMTKKEYSVSSPQTVWPPGLMMLT